jgi:hypothetical protein
LSALVIEEVADGGEIVRVSARTRDIPVPCPVRGVVTGRVHGYHRRTVRDVPVDGRQGVVRVRIRRLVVLPKQRLPCRYGQGMDTR